ncbi:hypothetical protein FXN65_10860 [Metapseudomonas lalkuanensis]|uniref:Uncharacterized protein n=1 Tax=Metapseudomonas lalkuanensis TaxID=2604832 RepID=A0A5J6QIX9_9GAMM|nr:hypothetical protein [Pseudomonas lalkuanensis]QEY62550.1 hypothetical protein FXN65_10860 [Pseudomonas lalkuanensis]
MAEMMLGGIAIRLQSGAPVQEYSPLGGVTVARRSGGAAVKIQHWRKTGITIRGTGWMGPGFAGLDFSQPLELRCTKQQSLSTTALTGTLPGTPRPDDSPWALAYVDGDWRRTPVAVAPDRTFTITAVPGALQYQVCWRPVFMVFCEPPPESMDPASNTHDWTITAEEI